MWAVSRRNARATIALGAVLAAAVLLPSFKASNAAADPPGCFSGAHSLSSFGSRLYPEMGNGGYTSLHTDLFLNYDAIANMFLPGTHADLQVQVDAVPERPQLRLRADERAHGGRHGAEHDRRARSTINGTPATFAFVQPTYPGDPNGQDDPDPAAHAVSNANPVSATNPNPPACSPQVSNTTQNGTQCPANKLVVTPSAPIPDGTTVTVTINYTGRPGVHTDGDGSTEGWFRIATAGSEGAFVTTEPVGNDSWMPMNNHPTGQADVRHLRHDEHRQGRHRPRRAGRLHGAGRHDVPAGARARVEPAGRELPGRLGDVALALAGADRELPRRELDRRLRPVGADEPDERRPVLGGPGVARSRRRARRPTRPRWTTRKTSSTSSSSFNGPWPLTTDGIVVGTPSASFEEEMQGKITFAGGSIGGAAALARHVQPREHAPVVRRQRRRGRVQPHVVEGGLRHARRVPRHRAHAPPRPRAGSARRPATPPSRTA